jgi:hypothetical protein
MACFTKHIVLVHCPIPLILLLDWHLPCSSFLQLPDEQAGKGAQMMLIFMEQHFGAETSLGCIGHLAHLMPSPAKKKALMTMGQAAASAIAAKKAASPTPPAAAAEL